MTLFRYQHDLSDMIRKKHSLNLFMRIWGLRIANSLKSKENELRAEAFYECRQKVGVFFLKAYTRANGVLTYTYQLLATAFNGTATSCSPYQSSHHFPQPR